MGIFNDELGTWTWLALRMRAESTTPQVHLYGSFFNYYISELDLSLIRFPYRCYQLISSVYMRDKMFGSSMLMLRIETCDYSAFCSACSN